jgi:hypothetical protein
MLVLLVQRPQPFATALPRAPTAAARPNRTRSFLSSRGRRRNTRLGTRAEAHLGPHAAFVKFANRHHTFNIRPAVAPSIVTLMPRPGNPCQELPDQLRRGDDLPDRLGGCNQMPEKALAQRRGIADDDQQPPRSRNGDVQALFKSQKANVAPTIGAHQRQHDDVLLAAFERVDCVNLEHPVRRPVVRAHQASQQVALFGVGRNHADRQVWRRMARQVTGNAGDQTRLGNVEQRRAASARLDVSAQRARIHPGNRRRKRW